MIRRNARQGKNDGKEGRKKGGDVLSALVAGMALGRSERSWRLWAMGRVGKSENEGDKPETKIAKSSLESGKRSNDLKRAYSSVYKGA
jgi:hypothetical protein